LALIVSPLGTAAVPLPGPARGPGQAEEAPGLAPSLPSPEQGPGRAAEAADRPSPIAGAGACTPMSEGGCGVASAADVAPVARLAGIMQFLTRAEPLLGCDRDLDVPLATEVELLDALTAHLPPALEPLARWTKTGKVELPDGDVRRQHW